MDDAEYDELLDEDSSYLSSSSDPFVVTSIGRMVPADPFDRDHWLVYHADGIEVYEADAEFIVEVDGESLPDAYATCDEAVLAAQRSRAVAE